MRRAKNLAPAACLKASRMLHTAAVLCCVPAGLVRQPGCPPSSCACHLASSCSCARNLTCCADKRPWPGSRAFLFLPPSRRPFCLAALLDFLDLHSWFRTFPNHTHISTPCPYENMAISSPHHDQIVLGSSTTRTPLGLEPKRRALPKRGSRHPRRPCSQPPFSLCAD